MTEQRPPEQRQEDPLQTEQGITRIEDSVVAKIAGIAAQEVEGVRMGGGATQAIGGILSSMPGIGGGGGSAHRDGGCCEPPGGFSLRV